MTNTVIIYTDTTSTEAVDRYVREWSREACRLYSWKRRKRNVARQKVAGILLMVITVPAVRLLNGDATIAAITIPAGIGLIMSAKTV